MMTIVARSNHEHETIMAYSAPGSSVPRR